MWLKKPEVRVNRRGEGHTWVPAMTKTSWWGRLWSRFWAVPVALSIAAIILGVVFPQIEATYSADLPVFFDAGASGARGILTTIAQSMISVTGLVFSITMVVLQLASSQFTPRVVGNFQDSRVTQFTLGTFIATFIYSLTVVRAVRSDPEFIPQASTTFAFLLVLVSMGLFLAFIRQIMLSINMSEVLQATKDAGLDSIDDVLPVDPAGASYGNTLPIGKSTFHHRYPITYRGHGGYLSELSLSGMLQWAKDNDAVVDITVTIGEPIPIGYPLGMVYSQQELDDVSDDLIEMMNIANERTHTQDMSFAVRQLVDIAERALSPGVNDPTTAKQVLDCLHSLTRVAVQRRVPDGQVVDEDGTLRLCYQPQQIEDYLRLAFEEISFWGAATSQIPMHIDSILSDLETVSLPAYRETLAELREHNAHYDSSANKPSAGDKAYLDEPAPEGHRVKSVSEGEEVIFPES